MGTLLDTYKAIQETEAEKVAEEVTEEVVDEGQETLRKYAEGAEGLLAAEYGEDYDENDVIKLAGMMIDYDVEQETMLEKVAELEDMGTIIGQAIKAELAKD
jgi:hypothetical protein